MKLADFNLFISGFAVGVALGAVKLGLYSAAAIMAVLALTNFYFYWKCR
jgi:hypothetical protein